MAEGKKSFTAYCDWKETFDSLPDEKAGQLIKHLFSYVNDENPQTDDILIKAVFAQIKATLKRDLKKWEAKREKNKENALKRWNKNNANVCDRIETDAKNAVSDSVSVSVSDINTNVFNKNKKYEKNDFFEDWNELRTKHLKMPSHIKSFSSYDHSEFKKLCEDYTREDFRNALIGLFKQKKLPNDSTSMQSNPTHFLKFFNSYLTAFHDQNASLYGKKQIQE